MKGETISNITDDHVDIRCLQGENGDNIPGYEKIGKVTSNKLSISSSDKIDTLLKRGYDIYIRNRLLIDMSLCPYVLENMSFILESFRTTSKYDGKGFVKKIMDLKIKGMASEAGKVIASFKPSE
jgi:5'-3' exonuclease